MAPVMAYLSEKTEQILTGKAFPFNLGQFMKDVFRGIVMALRNLVIELFLTACLLLLAFVPVIGISSTFLIFLVESYFLGFSMLDYYYERKRYTIKYL